MSAKNQQRFETWALEHCPRIAVRGSDEVTTIVRSALHGTSGARFLLSIGGSILGTVLILHHNDIVEVNRESIIHIAVTALLAVSISTWLAMSISDWLVQRKLRRINETL